MPVRVGKSCIVVHLAEGRFLFETKIWRGEASYEAGISELSEHAKGENSDGRLLGAFYIVCDPTASHQAIAFLATDHLTVSVEGSTLDVYIVDLIT